MAYLSVVFLLISERVSVSAWKFLGQYAVALTVHILILLQPIQFINTATIALIVMVILYLIGVIIARMMPILNKPIVTMMVLEMFATMRVMRSDN
jgi:hypothetical protein